MILLIVIVLVLAVALVGGWRALAAETSPRAANAVLLMIVGVGFTAWLLSDVSF